MTDQALTYVEIDVDTCALSYGVAPCTASIPTTGPIKCFNSLKTCQDRPNFDNAPQTLRFVQKDQALYAPASIQAIASLLSVQYEPGAISLGGDLGLRASLTLEFEDHPWGDTGPGGDKYRTERPYDPSAQGSFWGKFRARQPFLRGRPLRLKRGLLGQTLMQMETRHFVIESFDGPTPQGRYQLVAKDVLKLADGDRAQAPTLSNGFLITAITDTDTAATMSPAGIGDEEYPASGYVAIGGTEICAFTRVGNALTLTRGQLGTDAQSHESQDRVQLVIRYEAQDPAIIIADLLENYAGIAASYLPTTDWQTETSTYYGRLMTATIAEPTSVRELVSDIIEQAALAVWWDDLDQEVKLQVLRAITADADQFTPDTFMRGTLESFEQPDTRLSQVWVYFGQINPLEGKDDPDNYRSVAAVVDLEAEADYGSPAVKKIYSRFIPAFGRPIALQVASIQLGRFRDPPRSFKLEVHRLGPIQPQLGGGYQLEAWPLQDATGARALVPIQVTRLRPDVGRPRIEAQEVLFTDYEVETDQVIIIDTNANDLNLRTIHGTLYPEAQNGDVVICTIEAGVVVGSTSAATPAFDIGSWNAGVSITLIVKGRIQGKGGAGGAGGFPTGSNGSVGGPALYTRYAIDLDVDEGEIWGGGGGGGGGNDGDNTTGGGGGAGTEGGGGGGGDLPGATGTATAGGAAGGAGAGAGGGPGLAGAAGGGTSGGAAGAAIDGVSYVTVTEGPGDRRGGEIN